MSVCTSLVRSLARCTHARAVIPSAMILSVLAGAAIAAPPVIYNIGVMPGGTYTSGAAVSGDGTTVTGWGNTTVAGVPKVRPFRWVFPAGPIQVIPMTVESEGHGISFNGQHVVGHTINSSPVLPFRWTVSSGFTPMNLLPGGTFAYLYSTTFNGAASAGFGNSTSGGRAIRWNSVGTAQDLGLIPGQTASNPSSTGYGISPDGAIVVGEASWAPGVQHAMRWNVPFGPMQSLGTLPGHFSARAFAVSTNNSTIVGSSSVSFSHGSPRAFRLKAPMPMQDLGFIPGSGLPTRFSQAVAVSGNGSRVVGGSFDSTFGQRAFIWMGSTGMLDLKAYVASLGTNVTGWNFEFATGISTDGTSISGSGTFNGQNRAFLIKGLPCLDPTAWWFPDPPSPLGICADPNWPVGSGPGLPGASVTLSVDSDGSDDLTHTWVVTVGSQGGTAPMPITGPIFEDPQSGLTFSVEGWNTPTITISNLRPAQQPQPEIGVGVIVTNPCGSIATSSRPIQIFGVCATPPNKCNPADIADDTGAPLPAAGQTGGTNNGVTEGDYNLFFATFFDAGAPCDIANDDGSPLPPFGPPGATNNGVTEGDYNLFFAIYFDGCAF
jgi:uncharacterized membrane protein